MSFISYAQNLEDVMLWRALRHVTKGFYIDVGAWRPREDSVTLAFYERDWHGINVEPDTVGHAAMAEARPRDLNLPLALGREVGEASFFRVGDTGLSTLDTGFVRQHQAAGHKVERRSVTVSTLAQICEDHVRGPIHFLKIDVEGAEADVLAGADFTRFRPWIVLLEATLPNSPEPSHEGWEPMLLDAGYRFAWFDGLNRFYVAEEQAEALLPAFREPPNVFDDYVSIAAIRKAVETEAKGDVLPELNDAAAAHRAEAAEAALRESLAATAGAEARQAADRAAAEARAKADRAAIEARAKADLAAIKVRGEADLAAAEARVRAAEARALEADTQRLLAEAELRAVPAPSVSPTRPGEPGGSPDALARPPATAPRIFFDASLTLFYGLRTPVGIVRAEHYVAEFLACDPDVPLDFVIFDGALRAYRALDPAERRMLRRILFERYGADQATALDLGQDPPPPPEQTVEEQAAEQEVEAIHPVELPADRFLDLPPSPPMVEEEAPPHALGRRFLSALRLKPEDFNTILIRDAARLMPVTAEQSRLSRLGLRLVRRAGLHAARGGHAVLFRGAQTLSGMSRLTAHVVRPDEKPPQPPEDTTPAEPEMVDQAMAAPFEQTPPVAPPVEQPRGGFRFRPGDVVLSMSNTWDYMDYDYLNRLCRRDEVKFVSVIYDVIAVRHPYTTPGEPHIYHRHWVEIGHLAAHLISISRHSTATYQRYVAEPNDLAPPITHAYLPNFLKARAEEIGEVAVPALDGENFAFFCSTIETRKNHQLLFHAWDRLVEERGIDNVPTLVFVGKWGWGTETMRLLVDRNWRWRKRLLVLDEISDAQLIWLYRHARFTLFPSISEGFGLAAAESLSFGTPVVVSNCPALVEASEGLMPAIDPFDLPAWVAEIRRLIIDDSHLNALRDIATRYRGPAYEEFGQLVRDTVLQLCRPDPAAPDDTVSTPSGVPAGAARIGAVASGSAAPSTGTPTGAARAG